MLLLLLLLLVWGSALHPAPCPLEPFHLPPAAPGEKLEDIEANLDEVDYQSASDQEDVEVGVWYVWVWGGGGIEAELDELDYQSASDQEDVEVCVGGGERGGRGRKSWQGGGHSEGGRVEGGGDEGKRKGGFRVLKGFEGF